MESTLKHLSWRFIYYLAACDKFLYVDPVQVKILSSSKLIK